MAVRFRWRWPGVPKFLVLLRRAFALCESLLRQATTERAAAYDPHVVRRHMSATIELASTIESLKGA